MKQHQSLFPKPIANPQDLAILNLETPVYNLTYNSAYSAEDRKKLKDNYLLSN